jgi:hypothetical protein
MIGGPIFAQQWEPLNPIVVQQWVARMQQMEMDRLIRSSSLTVEYEEHLTSRLK